MMSKKKTTIIIWRMSRASKGLHGKRLLSEKSLQSFWSVNFEVYIKDYGILIGKGIGKI